MQQGKRTPDETRVKLCAALLAGMSVSEAARKYDVSAMTASRFKRTIRADLLERVTAQRRKKLDDILEDCLRQNLLAGIAIAQATSDTEYIRRQNARELAALMEVLGETVLRLLEVVSLKRVLHPTDIH